MKSIDLNCDMGELKDGQEKNFDDLIMPYISSCNIACGFHSGSPQLIENTIKSAIANNVKIGAHPSYNDQKNFGRISINIDPLILMAELRYQISALKGMVESYGQTLNHVKPHGALYNDLAKDESLSALFVQLVKDIDPQLKIFALAHSRLIDACKNYNIQFVNEGFADRKYEQVNELRSRQLDHAVLHEKTEVLTQVNLFLEGKVKLYNKEVHEINVDSICLHSDTQGAVDLSKTIYHFLKDKEIEIAAHL